MPRDYAHVPKQGHRSGMPGWAWLLIGLLIGLFVALLIYINDYTASSNKTAVGDAFNSIFDRGAKEVRDVKKQLKNAPPPPAKNNSNKPRFDFYTILPELEVIIPKDEVKTSQTSPAVNKPGQSDLTQALMLQAGSFQRHEEADKLKAKLALQGISANIQTVKINQNETWHRVRIGPITQSHKLHETQRRLGKMGVASIIVKQK